jgi:hypothetical protein
LVCRLEASQEAAEANREDVLEATKQKARAVSERCELVLSAQKLKKEALAHSIEAKLEAAEAQRQVRIAWLSASFPVAKRVAISVDLPQFCSTSAAPVLCMCSGLARAVSGVAGLSGGDPGELAVFPRVAESLGRYRWRRMLCSFLFGGWVQKGANSRTSAV